MRKVGSASFREVISRGSDLSKRAAAGVSLACLIVIAYACSSHVASADAELRAQGATSPGKTAAPGRIPAVGSSLNLVNFTGTTLRAVYVSPSNSNGWEENVLGEDKLDDGDTVDIRFSSEDAAALWDIRVDARVDARVEARAEAKVEAKVEARVEAKVEAADEYYAEWKGLDLRGASRIMLLVNLAGEEQVVVAEVE